MPDIIHLHPMHSAAPGSPRWLPTSLQVKQVVGGELDGGTVPAHVRKGPAAGLHDFAGSVHYGVHELQVAAAQLHLRRHQALQLLAVLRLVQRQGGWRLGQRPAYRRKATIMKERRSTRGAVLPLLSWPQPFDGPRSLCWKEPGNQEAEGHLQQNGGFSSCPAMTLGISLSLSGSQTLIHNIGS